MFEFKKVRLLGGLILMTLVGCETTQPRYEPVYYPAVIDEAERSQPTPAPVKSTVEPVSTQSVTALLEQEARKEFDSQEWQRTIVVAERGLRVDRRNAEFYWLIARSYLNLDNINQAKAFAEQGLRYARQGSRLARDLQGLLSAP